MSKITVKPLNKYRQLYTATYGTDPEVGSTFTIKHDFDSMYGLLKHHITELRFVRKTKGSTSSNILCTSNFNFINTAYKGFPGNFDIMVHHNKVPKYPKEWYKIHNVVPTWDIIANNIRLISLKDIAIIDVQPFKTDKHLKTFIRFFNDYLIMAIQLHQGPTKIPVYVEDAPK